MSESWMGHKHGGQSCLVNQLHYIHSEKESSSRTFERELNWGVKAEKTEPVISEWLLCLRTNVYGKGSSLAIITKSCGY